MPISNAAIVGIAIAAALCGALLTCAVGAAVFFWRKRQAHRNGFNSKLFRDKTFPAWIRDTFQVTTNWIYVAHNQHPRMVNLHGTIAHRINSWVSSFVKDSVGCTEMIDGEECEITCVPENLPIDEFERLAGNAEDWERQLCSGNHELTLWAFVGRAIAARMDPMADVETTLLPQDLVRVYQDIMVYKEDPESNYYLLQSWQHLWRTLTVRWTSHRYLSKTMASDDPRLPNIIRLEEEIIQTLAPFNCHDQGKIFEPRSREFLRLIIKGAAELALLAFEKPEPCEFFWPETWPEYKDKKEGDQGRRIAFFPGVRDYSEVPGSRESDGKSPHWCRLIPPGYSNFGIERGYDLTELCNFRRVPEILDTADAGLETDA